MQRLFQWLLITALVTTAQVGLAQGERFPTRPIQIVITSTPGSASDVITRFVGNDIAKTLGQPIVVISKASAAGTVGADHVRRAEPDGHTLFLGGNTTMSANVFLVKNLSYDPLRDFEPVSLVSINPLILVRRMAMIGKASTPEELTEFQKGQTAMWGRLVKESGLEPQ